MFDSMLSCRAGIRRQKSMKPSEAMRPILQKLINSEPDSTGTLNAVFNEAAAALGLSDRVRSHTAKALFDHGLVTGDSELGGYSGGYASFLIYDVTSLAYDFVDRADAPPLAT